MSVSSDHPRACGELSAAVLRRVAVVGSSPRMRGTLSDDLNAASPNRIIPAHAGNSRRDRPFFAARADHPRACGELCAPRKNQPCEVGSSPRMRGTPVMTLHIHGLSRIIPAHAGNSVNIALSLISCPDHPRACGELPSSAISASDPAGSSPRMRGTLQRPLLRDFLCRIIPAHAGNSANQSHLRVHQTDHPRACGELQAFRHDGWATVGSRMRGTPGRGLISPRMRGTLPHRAGSSPRMRGTRA